MWVLDPEAIITLECLRQRGIRLAVISNRDGNLRQALQDLNILCLLGELMVLRNHRDRTQRRPLSCRFVAVEEAVFMIQHRVSPVR